MVVARPLGEVRTELAQLDDDTLLFRVAHLHRADEEVTHELAKRLRNQGIVLESLRELVARAIEHCEPANVAEPDEAKVWDELRRWAGQSPIWGTRP